MPSALTIDGWIEDDGVYIIAEIGNNHEGDLAVAIELLHMAADAGVNAVKFQSIIPELLVTPDQTARLAQLRRFQLPPHAWERLAQIAVEKGVHFLSTPFSLKSVDDLSPYVPAFKVASGDNNFVPLLRAVARSGKPVLLSTGMADVTQIAQSVSVLHQEWARHGGWPGFSLLHCVVAYPTPREHARLAGLADLRMLGGTLGYSDHTLGIEAAVLATRLGARVIEKHVTLDHHYSDFRDHALSADPEELSHLVARIRSVENDPTLDPRDLTGHARELWGAPGKDISPVERDAVPAVRRSIRAARNLAVGSTVRFDDLTWLRPADDGLPPGCEPLLLDGVLNRNIGFGDVVVPADVDR